MLGDVDAAGFKNAHAHFHAFPRRFEFQFVLAEFDLGGAGHLFGGISDHLLGQFHHLQIVRICPIEFQLSEFGVVLERNAFIAEVTPDLIHPFQIADQQTFEIQLERDTQIHILIEFVMMRGERTRRRTAIQRLEDGSFHFQKAVIIEECSQRLDQLRAFAECLADVRVHSQVGIALAGAKLGVVQCGIADNRAVFLGHILVRGERRDGFGEQLKVMHVQCHLAGFGAHHHTFSFDEITEVEHLVIQFEARLPHFVDAEEQLHLAETIFDVREGQLALWTHRADTPGEDGFYFLRLILLEFSNGLGAGVCAPRARGVCLYAFGTELFHFLQTNFFE